MNIPSNKLGSWPKGLAASVVAAVTPFLAGHVSAQYSAPVTVYSSNFNTDSDGTTYDTNYSLSGQGRWTSSDLTQDSDYVGPVGGLNGAQPDYSGELGGQYVNYYGATNYSSSPVSLYAPFNNGGVTAGVLAFNVDFEVTGSQFNTPENNFAWSFRDGSGNNVFAINFNSSTYNMATSQGTDSVKYTIGNLPTQSFASLPGIALNQKYHLSVGVNTLTGAVSGNVRSYFDNSQEAFTFNALPGTTATIAQIAATWTYTALNPGTNALAFDNYIIAVPEPSTWAMVGIGAGLACMAVRRRMRA